MTKPLKTISCLKKRFTPTLTIKGFFVYCTNKVESGKQRFDWKNALIDGAIVSALTFFSTLGGAAVTRLDVINSLEVGFVAAFSQFFVFLALKRGLIQKKDTDP